MGVKKIPVFKRADQNKQFETVVQQQIKSYRDEIADIQSNIKNLYLTLSKIDKSTESNISAQWSIVSQLQKSIDEIGQNVEQINLDDSRVKNIEISLHECKSKIDAVRKNMSDLCPSFYDLEEERLDRKKDQMLLQDKFKGDYDSLNNYCKKIENRQKDLEVMIDDVDKQSIAQMNDVRYQMKNLSKEVSEYKISADWVFQELKRIRKQVMIINKKFEYLDTRIKRLSGDAGE